MNNTYFFEFDYSAVVVIATVMITLLVQILLCFKGKEIWVKTIPTTLSVLSAVVFAVFSALTSGWDAIGYFFFVLLSLGLIVVSGIGWAFWAIVRKMNRI